MRLPWDRRTRRLDARVRRRRLRRELLVGLLLVPLSVVPLYLYVTRTQIGRLMSLRAEYQLAPPATPRLDPEQARLARRFGGPAIHGVPVLVYHGLGSGEAAEGLGRRFVVSREHFAEQMASLRAAGYAAITAEQLARYLRTNDPGLLPPRPVLITFDDGRTDAMIQADPILRDTGMRATMFVIGDEAEHPTLYYRSWDDLHGYASTGRWELQDHTYALHEVHRSFGRDLSALVDQRLGESLHAYARRVGEDLDRMQALLRSAGQDPVAFAYPFGDWGRFARPGVARTLRGVLRARFELAFDQDEQPAWRPVLPGDDPLHVHRLEVHDWTGPELLARLAQGERRAASVSAQRGLGFRASEAELARARQRARCAAGRPGLLRTSGTQEPAVALAISGAPTERTPALLDALEESGGRATIFLTGDRLAAHRGLLQRMLAGGDQLGNDTYDHELLAGRPAAFVRAQLARASRVIAALSGTRPCVALPPFGRDVARTARIAASLGMDTARWSVDPQSSRARSAGELAARVLDAVAPGSVVLLQDTPATFTLQALPAIVRGLHARGYEVVTIADLQRRGVLVRAPR